MLLGVNENSSTRQSKLAAWFVERGIKRSDVAAAMGVKKQRLSQILKGIYAKQEHIQFLEGMGIPRSLLPDPHERQKPGPKSKSSE